ncbi:hypothetical protein DBR11_10145 [Pedobacter sp. HMWF019]|uniref:CPBP family intramembrane glutamic endopeptidase n=1 Tax=Pedobacter sp. HMWF019 TaxID=2056856 RepID=UPI000D397D92|nr:CPBP family intramembrane glutamic endopeptidase [Pedobacter sp. HMWF019]PTT00341.1 hypothetical protein DBR11_10145 [Pedobacter sp. HMWF019]
MKHPLLKVASFFIVLWTATFAITTFYPALNNLFFYLLVSFVSSWLLLRTEGKTLSSLNFYPQKREHYLQLLFGFLAGATLLFGTAALTNRLTGQHWVLTKAIDPIQILMAFFSCALSVFVQEFTYRGYPFQTLLNNYGKWVAQAIVIIPFGIMHLHWNMSIGMMILIMLSTGLGSILFGEAYIRTKYLCLPIALHLGWNFAQTYLPRHISQNGAGFLEVKGSALQPEDSLFLLPYFPVVLSAYILLHFMKKNWLSSSVENKVG